MVRRKNSPQLSRQDWIDQGLKVLAERGVEAVRVEPLAKLLQVTKGSFYWHFSNRQALLDALLEAWVDRDTDRIIKQVDAVEGGGVTKIRRLFELAVEDTGEVERAIRAWATNDAQVAAVLGTVDERRLNYTKDLFLTIGFTPAEAMVRARMAYYALVGEFTVGTRSDQGERLFEIQRQHDILTRRD